MSDLHLAIPNNNKRNLLRKSLESLPAAATRYDVAVTVVDNASSDGSAEMVATDFPVVGLVRQASIRGSSANFNAGILAGPPSRYVGIMHEDAYPTPGSLDILIDFLDSHPGAGSISPRVRFPDGDIDATAARFPTLVGETIGGVGALSKWFRPAPYRQDGDTAFIVDYNSATCLVFRRVALEETGLFDESFPIFYEELDLTRRLASEGWETWFVPRAEVVHAGGVTRQREEVSPDVKARYSALAATFRRSRYLYFRKHHGRHSELAMRALDVALAIPRILRACVLRLLPGSGHPARASALANQGQLLRTAITEWPRLDPALQARLPPAQRS